jgi:phage shock protein PspC (stress-responsive transcriptional regulator)
MAEDSPAGPAREPRLWRKRRSEGGVLLGLCAGIGAHLGCDPVLVRLVFVILLLLIPAGLAVALIYLLFGLLVPYQPEGGS